MGRELSTLGELSWIKHCNHPNRRVLEYPKIFVSSYATVAPIDHLCINYVVSCVVVIVKMRSVLLGFSSFGPADFEA